jgi:uncharacterized membrane protein
MTLAQYAKLYAATVVAFFALDITWLGFVAKAFYTAQMGHLTRPDVQWVPAVAFYLIYIAAIIVLCVNPAIEKGSMSRAVILGAVFGLAAYAAFDLTGLALLKDYPLAGGVVDLIWGTVLTASVSGASYSVARLLLK